TIFLLILLAGFHTDGKRGLALFAVAGFLSGFYVLIKFSLGFGAILTLLAACVLSRRLPLIGRRLGIAVPVVSGGFLAGWLVYAGTVDGIGAFLLTGWEVSRGYSSAMSFQPNRWWIGVGAAAAWMVALASWAVVQRGPRTLSTLGVLTAPLFVAWKHGFVRQ